MSGRTVWAQAIANKPKSAHTRIFAVQSDLAKLRKQKLDLIQDPLTGKVPVALDAPATEATA